MEQTVISGLHLCLPARREGRQARDLQRVENQLCKPDTITLLRGRYQLNVLVVCKDGHALYALQQGTMTRTIHENTACPARFGFLTGAPYCSTSEAIVQDMNKYFLLKNTISHLLDREFI